MDIMIDIETLATSQKATVTQIAAVAFDPGVGVGSGVKSTFRSYVKPEGEQDHRDISTDTLTWWMNNHRDVYNVMMDNAKIAPQPSVVLYSLNTWANKAIGQKEQLFIPGQSRVWANGMLFDFGVLDNLADEVGVEPFWREDFRCHRDMRGLRDIAMWTDAERVQRLYDHIDNLDFTQGIAPHDAVYDCFYQLNLVRGYYDIIGVPPDSLNP